MMRVSAFTVLGFSVFSFWTGSASADSDRLLRLEPVSEPAGRGDGRHASAKLDRLRKAVADAPRLRKPRFELVHALVREERLQEAHEAAAEWRRHDAYSLLAVRQLGDVESALGQTSRAKRTYSSIVELLPRDVEARRALATIFKQQGDLTSARAQLLLALELSPTDLATVFELADVEQRLQRTDSAKQRFQAVISAAEASEILRYPARQRLAQIYGAERRAALAEGTRRAQHL